jgi:RNA polymerase sigma-54 factor
MATPQGTLPYKSFFSQKIETDDGIGESQKSIMEKVKSLIDREDPKKPLSDQAIVKALTEDGIQIARRTVTKYRELLKILPTHLRRHR